ncbi:MAG: hypothetical protein JNJ71_17895 [Rubrivivax sp.]|nr:hypothetical protein [Rubrivivax sp.]
MSTPSPVMRLMRLMTHVNIGAMLGMAAWLVWSGWQVSTGQIRIPRIDPPSANAAEPMRLVPVSGATRAAGHCLAPAPATRQAQAGPLSGADL